MIHRIVGFSNLAPFAPGVDARPALDEIQALGGTLARAFCGPLPWANQTLANVYAGLPGWLDACRERGLHGMLDYITEAGTGYALDAHVREVEDITAGRDNVLRVVANEPWHPSQGGRLTPQRCKELAQRMTGGPVGYGAAEDDEGTTYAGRDFCCRHQDRGRDKWNQVRRKREGAALSEATGRPVLEDEDIGAGEADIAGKRCADPNVFFAQAVLCRLFELGAIFHSEDGLNARVLGPNQRLCAEAFMQGARVWSGTDRLTFKNATWSDSPVKTAKFNDGRNEPGCTRAYSGLSGNEGMTVAVGVVGDPQIEWQNGWRPVEALAERPGVTVWRVVQG